MDEDVLFKDKEEIMNFYKTLKYGDRIEITRDLSVGKLQEDMIQTIGFMVLPKNKKHVLNILSKFPIIDMKKVKEEYR